MTKLVTQRQLSSLKGNGCIVTRLVHDCGPYAYLVKKKKGVQTWKYLGRVVCEEEAGRVDKNRVDKNGGGEE